MFTIIKQVKVCVGPNFLKFSSCVDDNVNVEVWVLFSGLNIPLLTVYSSPVSAEAFH